MFIIDLHYIASLEEIDRHMTEHVKFLQDYYKKKVFITSGRKIPRTGGIILAQCQDREMIEKIIKEDPFVTHGLATFNITEFMNSQSQPEMKSFLKTLATS